MVLEDVLVELPPRGEELAADVAAVALISFEVDFFPTRVAAPIGVLLKLTGVLELLRAEWTLKFFLAICFGLS